MKQCHGSNFFITSVSNHLLHPRSSEQPISHQLKHITVWFLQFSHLPLCFSLLLKPQNIVIPPPPPPIPSQANGIYTWVYVECNYTNLEDVSCTVFCDNLNWEDDVGLYMCVICYVVNKPHFLFRSVTNTSNYQCTWATLLPSLPANKQLKKSHAHFQHPFKGILLQSPPRYRSLSSCFTSTTTNSGVILIRSSSQD